MTLEEKIILSRERLEYIYHNYNLNKVAVAWTGGKDSTIVLYLWRKYILDQGSNFKIKAINLDTKVKFPQILKFINQMTDCWSIDLSVYRPNLEIDSYPVAEDPVQCCYDLKIKPLKRAIQEQNIELLLTGLRKDEHPERGKRTWSEKKEKLNHHQIHPIFHWTEMDIWSFTFNENLPYCPLYDQGYRSLGCQPCTQPAFDLERSGRNYIKEDQMQILRSLGYF